MNTFVNPYTFVPFPDLPDDAEFRHSPAGHERLGDGPDEQPRYQGRIRVEVTVRAPLLLRHVTRESATDTDEQGVYDAFPRRAHPTEAGSSLPFLPGSSLAGAFRSLHEILAGGCLRVFDSEFTPVYRDLPKSRGASWRMAVVQDVDSAGRPTNVGICGPKEQLRVHPDALGPVSGQPQGDLPVTGMRFSLREKSASKVVKKPAMLDWRQDGDWVLLLTDVKERAPVTFAARRYPDSSLRGRGRQPLVSDDAWQEYLTRVEGSDDMRRARQDGSAPLSGTTLDDLRAEVRVGDRTVGYRHVARSGFLRGQVIWVNVDKEQDSPVVEIALSQVWRHSGTGSAGERVPPALLPCPHESEDASLRLCSTCRVFGAADTDGEESAAARQRSYRGHLRFSDGVLRAPQSPPLSTVRELPPLGQPRPGAGQFYLHNEKTSKNLRSDQLPLREWGSVLDEGAPRPLRGRKQYWLSAQERGRPLRRLRDGETFRDEPPEGKLTGGGNNVMAGRAETVEPLAKDGTRTRFTVEVRYENLALAELGGVLAALEPSRVLAKRVPHHEQPQEIGIAVGGGRPLGFGCCQTAVTTVEAEDAAARYLGQENPGVTVEQAVREFERSVPETVRDTWKAAAAALHIDHALPKSVWYPPAQSLLSDEVTVQQFEVNFTFWEKSRGDPEEKGPASMVVLPDATAPQQTLKAPVSPEGEPRPHTSRGGQQPRRGGK